MRTLLNNHAEEITPDLDLFVWAQDRIPSVLRLTHQDKLTRAECHIPTPLGTWLISLTASASRFIFFAVRNPENPIQSIEVSGLWPENQQTLDSVLASLPRSTN